MERRPLLRLEKTSKGPTGSCQRRPKARLSRDREDAQGPKPAQVYLQGLREGPAPSNVLSGSGPSAFGLSFTTSCLISGDPTPLPFSGRPLPLFWVPVQAVSSF